MSEALRIWIDEGCIQCYWCQNLCPEVFVCGEGGTQIRAGLLSDRHATTNRVERCRLTAKAREALDHRFLQFVADGCPAKVIKLDPPYDGL